MKITSSNLQLSSQHVLVEQHQKKESLRAWVGDRRPDFEGRQNGGARPRVNLDTVNLSSQAKSSQAVAKTATEDDSTSGAESDVKMQILVQMIERLTGKKIKLMSMDDLKNLGSQMAGGGGGGGSAPAAEASNAPQRAGFGVEYDSYRRDYEAERMNFSATGVVTTADGKQINIDVALSMSREFVSEQSTSVRLGDAAVKMKDPLVINFSGTAAQLTDTKFQFDIDANGTEDQISFVGPGSGFLALDKNNDGIINDGSELFGAKSGDGFGDLAKYDSDGNQWIDENDAIYSKLRIWSKDEQGNDVLVGLGQRGIGAIYLGNVSSEFSMKDSANATQGQVRQTGIFLGENGGVGTVQKIDLAV